jgi:hypothetical protein
LCDRCLIDIVKVEGRKAIEKITPLCHSSQKEQQHIMLGQISPFLRDVPQDVKINPLGIVAKTYSPDRGEELEYR